MQKRLEHAGSLFERGDLTGAERALRELLHDAPGEPAAHNLLGLVQVGRGEYSGAIGSFAEAIRLRQPYPEALINLALACNRVGGHEVALDACAHALAAAPGNALALVNQGQAHKGLRQLAEARRSFENAAPNPMARYNLGHVLMIENHLEAALPLLEARRGLLRVGEGLAGRPWQGEARPEGTLLVIPEQGLGDFLLMSRFFPALAGRFRRVIVHAPAPLARLVAGIDPRLEVVTTLEGARWDVWAPIMSLPLLLGITRIEDVPTAPWIRVEAAPAAGGARRPRVGINWAGNPSYAYDAVRSTSLETFESLLAVEGIEWVSLHRGVRELEADAYGLEQPLRDARDFLDTARVIAGLDLVVSTETAVPNLSGAMGVPTCVLTVRDVDWRWDRWYPSVTVCPQQSAGNWYGPIANVAEALVALVDRAAADAGALAAEAPGWRIAS